MVKKEKSNSLIFFFLFFLIVFITSATFFIYPQSKDNKLLIVSTIFPLQEFARAVCGERGEVFLLLPPGADVHSWKPRPSDILKISEADCFLMVGANLEPWVGDILQSLAKPGLRIIQASLGLTASFSPNEEEKGEHEHYHLDPHVWLDFDLDKQIVEKIKNVLIEIDPEAASIYSSNASGYKDKLHLLDRRYSEEMKDCSDRTLVIAGHAAFGYLARRYRLEQVALYGISPDSRPTPREMIRLINLVRERGIKAIYFEQAVTDEVARVISRETGVKTLVLNPGANISQENLKAGMTFIDIMEQNLENLKNGLGCH